MCRCFHKFVLFVFFNHRACGLVYDRDGGKLDGQPDYMVFKSPKDVKAENIKPVRIMYVSTMYSITKLCIAF